MKSLKLRNNYFSAAFVLETISTSLCIPDGTDDLSDSGDNLPQYDDIFGNRPSEDRFNPFKFEHPAPAYRIWEGSFIPNNTTEGDHRFCTRITNSLCPTMAAYGHGMYFAL